MAEVGRRLAEPVPSRLERAAAPALAQNVRARRHGERLHHYTGGMSASIIACPACGAKNRVGSAPAGTLPTCGRCGAGLPWLTTGSDATFAADVTSPVPVVVDMWAPWCGPCRMVAPVLEALSRELAGRLKVVKLNVDDNPVTASRFGVQSIPTLLVVKGGQVVDQVVGAMPKGALRARLEPHLVPERAA